MKRFWTINGQVVSVETWAETVARALATRPGEHYRIVNGEHTPCCNELCDSDSHYLTGSDEVTA